jgi:prepilin-type N-terminal cleavage/methylation domain-containing protein
MARTRDERRTLSAVQRPCTTAARGGGASNRRAPWCRRHGFTLVEILVTIALILVLLAMIGWPILNGMAFMEMGVARADAQSAARLAIDTMTRELAEAMYVFDIPIGGRFVAFLPTRSSGARVAPIEPEAIAIRYWRALRDPYYAYAPFYQVGASPVDTMYVARSEIPNPAARDDDWNDSGGALTRATFWYPDDYTYDSQQWPTAQPGYPWLEAVQLNGAGSPPPAATYQWYRERAVGLTPNDADYDIPSFGCAPARITEEALIPWTSAFPRDYSRYRSRYPLWACFAQWNPAASPQAFESMGQVKVYTGDPRVLTYETRIVPTTGQVLVYRVGDSLPIYDTASYPQREASDPDQASFAFGIDYDSGEVRFDFPVDNDVMTSTGADRYSPPTLSLIPDGAFVNGSTSVWVTDLGTGASTYYRLVPDPAAVGAGQYAIDNTTGEVVFDAANPPAAGLEIHAKYRYRNNADDQLVVATYDTKAIISISLTVAKRNRAGGSPEKERQDVSLSAKVKLKNLPR